jgi:hypothetical protein
MPAQPEPSALLSLPQVVFGLPGLCCLPNSSTALLSQRSYLRKG